MRSRSSCKQARKRLGKRGDVAISHFLLILASTATTLLVGVYLVAVIDTLLSRSVAGARAGIRDALTRPVQAGALSLLQGRTLTERPDNVLWALAPAIIGASAAASLALIPLTANGAASQVAPGIVYFGAAMALVMVAVYFNGWSANSMFSVVGGYRFIALALSYEMPLALVLIGAALPAQSLSVGDIVNSQAGMWNVVRQPLGLPLYLIASTGLAFWGPLNFSDANDLAGGSRVELSGVDRLLWRGAHLSLVVAAAAMGAAVFLGGWRGPLLPGPVWMFAKTLVLVAMILYAGHTFARVRLEWFVRIAWTILIPASLVDVFGAGVTVLMSKPG